MVLVQLVYNLLYLLNMLNDIEIEKLANDKQMIGNFISYKHKREDIKHLSYGLNAVGYDVRLGNEVKVAIPENKCADPLIKDSIEFKTLELEKNQFFVLPPQTFALSVTVEHFKIPENITCNIINKSTLARCGINILTTKINPGWQGDLTLELFNYLNQPIKLYPNQGICTIQFFKINKPKHPYNEKNGKYQKQKGLTHHL